MNWLAHLYLTPPTPEGWLGALLGDVVRGPIGDDFDPQIRHAIALHRRIDALTATHPSIRQSCARIDASFGHYRRVIVDVFYDHVLATTWSEWSDLPLPQFVAQACAGIDEVLQRQPQLTPAFYAPMRRQGWLESYAAVDGIGTALRRMRRRLRRDHPIDEAVHDLVASGHGFRADFAALFPDAIAQARQAAAG